jgi:hypothetical protein
MPRDLLPDTELHHLKFDVYPAREVAGKGDFSDLPLALPTLLS